VGGVVAGMERPTRSRWRHPKPEGGCAWSGFYDSCDFIFDVVQLCELRGDNILSMIHVSTLLSMERSSGESNVSTVQKSRGTAMSALSLIRNQPRRSLVRGFELSLVDPRRVESRVRIFSTDHAI
jgi:hypothetical protein